MHPGVLIGLAGGFLLGTAGVKAVTSKPAKKLAVKTIVCGMKVKEGVTNLVDDARVQFDDLMAEASYEKRLEADETVVDVEEVVVEEADEEETDGESPKSLQVIMAARPKTLPKNAP